VIVDDRDAVGRQGRNRGGHKMLDGADLAAVKPAAGLQHHAGGRLLVVAAENLPLGDHQVHARGLDAVDGLDRACQFAFERAQPVDVLDEGGGAESIRLVEYLIADAGGGQIVLRQRHAQLGHLVRRHQHRAAVLDVILDRHGVQLGCDLGGIARLQPGEQNGLGGLGDGAGYIKKECSQDGGHTGHDAEPRRSDCFEEIRQDLSSWQHRSRHLPAPGYC
jgi:hypothetical protein